MSLLSLLLVIIFVALFMGALPVFPYNAGWGPYPVGGIGLILLIIILLLFLR